MIRDYDNAYWLGDLNLYTEEMEINNSNFFDVSHMNRKGSVKNTFFMISKLEAMLGIKANMENVFAYEAESIVYLTNGIYRYTMINTLPEARYSFILYEDGDNILETKFSIENYVDLPGLLEENQILTCSMIPYDCDEDDYIDVAEKAIRISFMKELNTDKTILIQQ